MDATTQARTFVAYLRVSTDKQGKSGLGLEAQQAAITAFLRPGDRLLAPPFVEVESGRNVERPQLRAAMDRCRRTGATLLIAKLDRLSRDAHFLLGLQKAGVEFVAADMPNANRLTVGIMAMVAEEEARAISVRTKAALAAAKARGTKLGGDRGYRPSSPPDAKAGGAASGAARSLSADHAAFRVATTIEAVKAEGAASLRQIADALTARGVPTPSGEGAWTATAVRRVLARVERVTAPA
ncbi:recombinase family protein [Roseomonas stagni]|uniref:Recombinase family protein n=1 Tax=Falsiroseomonas algicola TaxID=2716930 RepID=A0A6M1LIU8_9PROT|nr:recombinase family protein [Falsiroseomonas algicola]NGM19929.1 recombinase family protein [Falsiroseomonas algicola]